MYTHVHCLHSCTQICTNTFHYASMKLVLCIFVYTMYTSVHTQHLEIPVLNHASYGDRKGSRCLHEICHDSIAVYNLSTHQLLGE